MSFDLNILVNGNRCKQYYHQGKTFIEAKNGSEYVIEIKNNHYKRVLAVGSVDGLNILTGKKANHNDTGYIVGAYSTEKIKGFRYSDDEWAMFKFGYKFYGNTYAQSKEDGSEKNCGIIGLRLFYENEPVYTYTPPPTPIIWNTPPWLGNPDPNWSTTTITTTTGQTPTNYVVSSSWSNGNASYTGAYQSNVNYTCNTLGQQNLSNAAGYQSLFGDMDATKGSTSRENLLKEAIADAKAVRQTAYANSKGSSTKISARKRGGYISAGGCSTEYSSNKIASVGGLYGEGRFGYAEMEREQPKAEFDMGTEWGRKERSKVHNVKFDRGCLVQSFDIYYASREALINMGVILTNEMAVNLPQSFPNEYAQPPAGWRG